MDGLGYVVPIVCVCVCVCVCVWVWVWVGGWVVALHPVTACLRAELESEEKGVFL
jgi:hypothetical protein